MYSSSDYRSGECGTLGCDAQDSSAGAGPNTSDTLQSSHGLPHQTTRKALLILPSPRAESSTHLPQSEANLRAGEGNCHHLPYEGGQ